MKAFSYLWQYLDKFFLVWEMFRKNLIENIETHISGSVTFFENRVVYEIMSKNVLKPEGPQMTSQYGACTLHAG
jgi:hypothetical protein